MYIYAGFVLKAIMSERLRYQEALGAKVHQLSAMRIRTVGIDIGASDIDLSWL